MPDQTLFSECRFAELAEIMQRDLNTERALTRSLTIYGGIRVGASDNVSFYTFAIPDEIYLKGVYELSVRWGRKEPFITRGWIVEIRNQFATIALPHDVGETVPEITIEWSYDRWAKFVEYSATKASQPSSLAKTMMNPETQQPAPALEFFFTPETPIEQQNILKSLAKVRCGYVWGPVRSGKAFVAILSALSVARTGKKVLLLGATSSKVDKLVHRLMSLGTSAGLEVEKMISRVGYAPQDTEMSSIEIVRFEREVYRLQEEKRNLFQERIRLLRRYRELKLKYYLAEDFYVRAQKMRARQTERKAALETLKKETMLAAKNLEDHRNSSLVERLKKGFSKQEEDEFERVLSAKKEHQQLYQQAVESMQRQLIGNEAVSPVSSDESMEFKELSQRIDDLGGEETIQKSINDFIEIDPVQYLTSKRIIATTVDVLVNDRHLQSLVYDAVIVDDADAINVPTLLACSTLAKERLLFIGDPFRSGPDSASNTEQAQDYLQCDVFTAVSGGKELIRLYEWTEQHRSFSGTLTSQFAATPALSLFSASVFYDDKINVFSRAESKGGIYFVDTSSLGGKCLQFAGKKKILPYNELQTKKVVDVVKYALISSSLRAADVGVVIPFYGASLYTRMLLAAAGLMGVEVGTPQSFDGRSKKIIVFDTVMAGVDYTIRQLDDKKIGETKIIRLLNTIISCVESDFYIVADVNHFKSKYPGRLITRLLMLLQAQSSGVPNIEEWVRKFDTMEPMEVDKIGGMLNDAGWSSIYRPSDAKGPTDVESLLQIKMMKQQSAKESLKPLDNELSRQVRRVTALYRSLNTLAQNYGNPPIFHSSQASEQTLTKLVYDIPSDERSFGKCIDQWHVLINELIREHPVDDALLGVQGTEARVRNEIRDLKGVFLNDPEILLEEGKQKITASVTKTFNTTIGKPKPTGPAEWQRAYSGMVTRLEQYLQWLIDQYRK